MSRNRNVLLLTSCVVITVLCGICSVTGLALLKFTGNEGISTEKDQDETDYGGNATGITEGFDTEEYDYLTGDSEGVLEVYRPELDLLVATFNIIKEKGLNNGSYVNFSYDDFDRDELKVMKQKAESYNKSVVYPEYVEDLFDSPEAYDDVERILFEARKEYITVLREKGVDSKLIREIDQTVFPPDDDHLTASYTDDVYAEFSFTSWNLIEGEEHLQEAYMRVELGQIGTWSNRVHQSGILGKEPLSEAQRITYWKQLREYGTRLVFYHEMTHVMQVAYENVMARKFGDSFADMTPEESTMYRFADNELLLPIDGTVFDKEDNIIVVSETQAQSLLQYMMQEKYDLNNEQAKLLWDHCVGGTRMNIVREQLKELLSMLPRDAKGEDTTEISELKSIGSSLENVAEQESDVALKGFLLKTARQSSIPGVAAAVGYANPYSNAQVNALLESLQSM